MPLAPDELTQDDIIAYAKRAGVSLSKTQLVRWHGDDLLPRPRQVPRGRGQGTLTAYPLIAAPLAVFLAHAKARHRSLDKMAWAAWLAGYPLTARVRPLLVERFRTQLTEAVGALDAFEREVPDNPIDAALAMTIGTGDIRIAKAFRPTVMRIVYEVLAGTFDPRRYDAYDFDHLVGERREPKKVPKQPPEAFDWVSRFLHPADARVALDAVTRLSDAQLETDRSLAMTIWSHAFLDSGSALPLTLPAFEIIFRARRVSAEMRWAMGWVAKEARRRGFANVSAFWHSEREKYNAP